MGTEVELLPVDLGQGITAGFTTRHGGVSPEPWDSSNLGPNVDDAPGNVAENRARLAAQVGAPIAYAWQVHGNRVLSLSDEDRQAWAAPTPPISAGEADAMVMSTRGLGLAVLVADCVPVLLADAKAGIVAVAHAGRRGIELDVIGQTVAALRARGANTDGLAAAIGPAICGNCYEVPEDMREDLASLVPAAWAQTRLGTPGLDLPAAAAYQLKAAGVTRVTRLEVCTYEDERMFSHRRATHFGQRTGRQAGFVVAKM